MKLFAPLIRNQVPVNLPFVQTDGGAAQGSYQAYARHGYSGNEIVYACIELLASSAGEPHIAGRRWRRNRAEVRNQEQIMQAKGISRAAIHNYLVRNGYIEDLPDHPLVKLLNKPNPFMSRGQMWGTVVMDRCLAGNAYLLKARYQAGPLKGAVAELWRLRPDRVRIVPGNMTAGEPFIKGYEYGAGIDKVMFPASDVIQFKTRNPLNEYYGMPPLMPLSGRVDIDNYMRSFLRTFFERGGTGPGAILAVKQRLSQESKDSLRERLRITFGGTGGFHETLVLDQAEATYTQMGLDRGLRDALPKELNALQEARIAMVFGIPGSIVGLLIGYESSSYANKRADWQVLWDVTMAPMLGDLDDVLCLTLVPEFGGIDEVYFDLTDIKALQEDVDKLQDRERKNFQAGAISLEEYRDAIGYNPDIKEGMFFVPGYLIVTPFEQLGEPVTEAAPVAIPPENRLKMAEVHAKLLAGPAIVAEPRCPKCDRRNGLNIQVGGSLTCARCREDFVVSALDARGNG